MKNWGFRAHPSLFGAQFGPNFVYNFENLFIHCRKNALGESQYLHYYPLSSQNISIITLFEHEVISNNKSSLKIMSPNRYIDNLLKWSIENKMKFHPSKCKALSVTTQRGAISRTTYLSIFTTISIS